MNNEDLVKQAREANLVAYLQANGTALVKKGVNRWQGVEHDSLVVSGNKFVWNSKGIEGNTLDYAIKVEGVPFREAVEMITGLKLEGGQGKAQGQGQGNNQKRILGYLCQTRGIDYNLVTMLIQAGFLEVDSKFNCVFNILKYGSKLNGGKGELVGAELHGTHSKKPYKGFTGGSKHHTGFNRGWRLKGPAKRLYAFESAIDLLSFITLIQKGEVEAELDGCLFLSLGGLKPEVLNTALLAYEVEEEVILCVDNDKAGTDFIEAIKGSLDCTIMQPDPIYKDWNDRLTGNCG